MARQCVTIGFLIICASILSNLCFFSPGLADPGSVILPFLEDEATMLDFGMFRLEVEMQRYFDKKFEGDPVPASIKVRYDWERDLVVVDFDTFIQIKDDGALDLRPKKEWIEMADSFIKFAQERYSDFDGDYATHHFGHQGYVSTPTDPDVSKKEVLEALAGRILLRVEGGAINDDGDPKSIFAEARLLEESITVGETH